MDGSVVFLFVNKNNREPWSPGPGRNKTKSTPVRETVITNSNRDGVSSNLVANLGRTVHNTLKKDFYKSGKEKKISLTLTTGA